MSSFLRKMNNYISPTEHTRAKKRPREGERLLGARLLTTRASGRGHPNDPAADRSTGGATSVWSLTDHDGRTVG